MNKNPVDSPAATSPSIRIGVSSYSFSRRVKSGEMQQIDVIAAAAEMGFDAIEFSTIDVPEGETLESFAAQLAAEAEKIDIPIANYTIGADFLNGSNGDLAAEIARLQAEVRVARILGVPGGTLEPGSPADLTIIDPTRVVTVKPEKWSSKSRNTPFAGRSLTGAPVMTVLNGQMVMKEGVVAESGTFFAPAT